MILLYHKVSSNCLNKWYVTTATFRKQMQYLRDVGKKVVPLSSYNQSDESQVVITFDGGYEEMYRTAAPILKEFSYPYEVFVIGNYIGKDNKFDTTQPFERFLTKDELVEMVKTGCHLQWHTNTHRNLSEIKNVDDWIGELTIPEDIVSLDPTGFQFFAYPHGGNIEWQREEVIKRFKGAVYVTTGTGRGPYQYNRETIFEDSDFNFICSGERYKYIVRKSRKIACGFIAMLHCIKEGRVMSAIRNRFLR